MILGETPMTPEEAQSELENWPEINDYDPIKMYHLAQRALETLATEELESRIEFHQNGTWYGDSEYYSGDKRNSYVKWGAQYDENRRVTTRRVSKSWVDKEPYQKN